MSLSNGHREEAITPPQLMKFLNIGMSRLRRWNEKGVFGEDYRERGHGKTRLYSFEDAVLGLVHKNILDLTKARTMKLTLSDDFIQTFREYIRVQLPAEVKREAQAADSTFLTKSYYDRPALIEICWEYDRWIVRLHQRTSGRKTLEFPTGISTLLIRLDVAVAEALAFFKREDAMLPRFLQE